MSLFNPGKNAVLTILALIIIVGVPGMIAYADDSSDTYYSDEEVTDINKVKIYHSGGNSTFGASAVVDGSVQTVVLDDLAVDNTTTVDSISTVTKYQFYTESSDSLSGGFSSKITFDSSLSEDSVSVIFVNSSNNALATFSLEYDESSEYWSYEVDSVDALSLDGAVSMTFVAFVSDDAAEQNLTVEYHVYAAETIFTEDVVELIVMVGGIALLICGTFALSFIDVDTPGKAIRSAGRGIRKAGNKMRRGKR